MSEHYRKQGRVARLELLRGLRHRLTVEESGSSESLPLSFRCNPIERQVGPSPSMSILQARCDHAFEAVLDAFPHPEALIRCIVTAGAATHHCSSRAQGDERSWSDETLRAHLTLQKEEQLIELELDLQDFDRTLVQLRILHQALRKKASAKATRPAGGLTLGPLVTAALWPRLAQSPDPPLTFEQLPCEFAPLDGDGLEIRPGLLSKKRFPNRFRPSYRWPAVALPHSLAVSPFGTPLETAAQAVALCGSSRVGRKRLELTLLLADGRISTFSLAFQALQSMVRHISPPELYTANLAGCWGQTVTLD